MTISRIIVLTIVMAGLSGCAMFGDNFTGVRTKTYECGSNTCTYDGEWWEGTKTGHGTLVWSHGHRYVGEWANDDFHGKGRYTWPKKPDAYVAQTYEGDWYYDDRTGQGVMVYSDGDRYEGAFVKGKRDGVGTYWYVNGGDFADATEPKPYYKGEFSQSKRHGRGKLVWSDGSVYEGEWRHGDKHGYGEQRYVDGTVYKGYWKNGQMHGEGTLVFRGESHSGRFLNGRWQGQEDVPFEARGMTFGRYEWETQRAAGTGTGRYAWPDGTVYEGEFVNGLPHGQGEKHYRSPFQSYDGDVARGEWREGALHGKGVLTKADGYRYEGEFRNDKRFGYGVETESDGDVYEGRFVNDQRHGYGRIDYGDNNWYAGDWQFGQKQGVGETQYKDGDRYKGMFHAGKRHGVGTYTFYNDKYTWQSRYEGQWVQGKQHGQGKKTWPNGKSYEGGYQEGKWHGEGVYRWSDGEWEKRLYNMGKKQRVLASSDDGSGFSFGQVFALAAGAAVTEMSDLSSTDKVDFFSSFASDVMTDGGGTGKPMAMQDWKNRMNTRLEAQRRAAGIDKGNGAGSGYSSRPVKPLRADGVCGPYTVDNYESADLVGEPQIDTLCAAGVNYWAMYRQASSHPDNTAAQLEEIYQMHLTSIRTANQLADQTRTEGGGFAR